MPRRDPTGQGVFVSPTEETVIKASATPPHRRRDASWRGWADVRYCAIYRRARAFAQECGSSEHDSSRKLTAPQEPGDVSPNFSRRRAVGCRLRVQALACSLLKNTT